jgi:hypothetical protein
MAHSRPLPHYATERSHHNVIERSIRAQARATAVDRENFAFAVVGPRQRKRRGQGTRAAHLVIACPLRQYSGCVPFAVPDLQISVYSRQGDVHAIGRKRNTRHVEIAPANGSYGLRGVARDIPEAKLTAIGDRQGSLGYEGKRAGCERFFDDGWLAGPVNVHDEKTPWRDGTTHVIMSNGELVEKLAALVRAPRFHLVMSGPRYG